MIYLNLVFYRAIGGVLFDGFYSVDSTGPGYVAFTGIGDYIAVLMAKPPAVLAGSILI
jgi:hypothetical protein